LHILQIFTTFVAKLILNKLIYNKL
jgi:hypothetical protein